MLTVGFRVQACLYTCRRYQTSPRCYQNRWGEIHLFADVISLTGIVWQPPSTFIPQYIYNHGDCVLIRTAPRFHQPPGPESAIWVVLLWHNSSERCVSTTSKLTHKINILKEVTRECTNFSRGVTWASGCLKSLLALCEGIHQWITKWSLIQEAF